MSKSKSQPAQSKPTRGTWLTVALVLVILSNLFMTAVYWSTNRTAENSSLVVTLMLLVSLASVVAGVAMWYWKKWGIYVYGVAAIASAVVALLMTGNVFMVFGALLPPIIVGYILLPKMSHFD
jgi:hypothetical protein